MTFQFQPIGVLCSPFKDRYGVPRQPSLVGAVQAQILLNRDPDLKTATRGLEDFSHLWVIFVFHDHGGKKWKPSIRPPRLGGREKVGVLSSRSPHRPNPIGISVVKLEKVETTDQQVILHISGVDMIDGTPVLDIKPYIPYADSFPEANPGWAAESIEKYQVRFSDEAENFFGEKNEELKEMIFDVLRLDPRPAYRKRDYPIGSPQAKGQKYGIQIADHEVKYEIEDQGLLVLSVDDLKSSEVK